MTRQNARRDERHLQRRLAELERRIKTLETAPRTGNASVSHGKFLIRDTDGSNDVDVLRVGYLGQYTDEDVRGTEVRRPTGELVLSTWSGADAGRFWGLFDIAENRVISDDALSGQGLATPYIGAPGFAPYDTSKWPSTTSASFVPAWLGGWWKQHPRLHVTVWTQSDSGTTGDVQVTCNGVSASAAIASADNGIKQLYLTVPGDHLSWQRVEIDFRRTGGSGFLGCWPMGVYGVQS